MAATETFRFLGLPPELRTRVNELAFEGGTATLPGDPGPGNKSITYTTPDGQASGQASAVPIANKQIHTEAIKLFYAMSTFIVSWPKKLLVRAPRLRQRHRAWL